jgi:tRNA threonylcarbamoyladenosine biosynthesis protein TsaE
MFNPNQQEFEINSLTELQNKIPVIWQQIQNLNCKIVLLQGEMGAGKTTFVSYLLKYLGSKDKVSSPTFSLVNHYQLPNHQTVFHFDCYRIKSLQEALEAGLEEYFYQDAWCIIEWPQNIQQLLPENFTVIKFKTNGIKRYISIHTISNK